MAYTVSADLKLGASNTGLTLTPTLHNDDGTGAAGLVLLNIHEVAAGSGSYHYSVTVPDNHRGYIKFSDGATWKTDVTINPDEVTNAYQRNLIADHVLCRDWSAVSLSPPARCLWQAVRFLRNKWEILAGVLSVKTENDTTEAWNSALTTDAGAVPITASDPS